MMKNIIILIFVLIPFFLLSQARSLFDSCSIGYTVGFGNSFNNLVKLNTFLIERNYNPVNEVDFSNGLNTYMVGVEVIDMKSHSYCKFSVQKSFNMLNDRLSNYSSINYAGFRFDFLYDLIKSDNWITAPYLGLGGYDFYLSAISKNKISDLTQRNLSESFYRNRYCLNTGIEIKRRFQVGKFHFSSGINCEYQIELGDGKWGNFNGELFENFTPSGISGLTLFFNSTVSF
jgi:hypothetical protein